MIKPWNEIKRQMDAYTPVNPPSQPPLSPGGDTLDGAFDACLRGAQKLKEDTKLQKLLHDVYQGKN